MLLFLTAAFVVFCSVLSITMACYICWFEYRRTIALDEPTTVTAPGKVSPLMAIPRKHPAVRTRHSRSL